MPKNKRHHDHKHSQKKAQVLRGIIRVTAKGIGYFESAETEEDVEIDASLLKNALNKDEVEIRLLPKKRAGRVQGEITRVISRAKTEFVGTLEEERGMFFLVPDDKKIHRDIAIRQETDQKLIAGQKAFVKMFPWSDPSVNPEGRVLKLIGPKGVHEVEMQSIILETGFDSNFPEEVEREAEKVAVTEKARMSEEVAKRRDFRKTLTFTIDPVDAKDFDDAISFAEVAAEKYEIGIHIADVSHYVREGGALDTEARKRGFSVYLVDRTIPMLPEILSNGICSLNPGEDRLAFSTVVKIEKRGNHFQITDRWFGKTIIHSNKRFSYEEAQKTLNDNAARYHPELSILNTIAKQLQMENEENGAIDFEKEEIKFKLDARGVPVEIYKKERLDTHKLVEEFMLLANREVAAFIGKKAPQGKSVSLYRIHDKPDRDKLANLEIFLKAMGFHLKKHKGEITAKDIQDLLDQVKDTASADLIKTATLRSMAKAVYSTENIGHFGLGFSHYTHFTSPIRRYADLVIHRILNNHLTGGKIKPDELAVLTRIASETSEKEISAAEAERASIKYKQVEYMTKYIGETFDATISGVTEWGIFVEEIETKAEGMVRLRSLGDDFYALNEKTYSIVGEKTGKKLSLGDKVRVKLTAADLDRKSLDFEIVNK